jgi:hypothetical protein
MQCPSCKCERYRVLPVAYDKTPERTIRTVLCGHCAEIYHQVIRVWNGDEEEG